MVLELTGEEIEKHREGYIDFIKMAVGFSRGNPDSVSIERPSLRKAYYHLHHWRRLQRYEFDKLDKARKIREEQRRIPIPNIQITPIRFSLVA